MQMQNNKIGLVTTKLGQLSGVTIIQDQLKTFLEGKGFSADLLRPIDTPFRGLPGIGYPLSYALLNQEMQNYDLVLGNGIGLMGALIAGIKYIDTIHSTPAGIDAALTKAVEDISPIERELSEKVLQKIIKRGFEDLEFELNINQTSILIDNIIANNAHSIVTVSSQTKKEVEKYFNIDSEKITIIPNGIDPMWWEGDLTPTNKSRLVFSGRAGSNSRSLFLKGYDRLLAVLQTHADMDAKIMVYNSNDDHAEAIKELFNVPRVDLQLRLTQKEMRDQMQPGDIYLSTSRYEAFGLSFVEAMARGLCVVCYPVGVAPELIVNGENGFIVESVSEMISLVEGLKHDVERTREIGKIASKSIKENYSLEKMGQAYCYCITRNSA